jgi:CheY-like chemotaxis protein
MSFPPVPSEEVQQLQQQAIDTARSAFSGKRLLLVDDDAAQRMTTRHKLQPLGAEIDQAADGQRALEALAHQHYDVVLLDLNMPLLDGYAVARTIRQGELPLNRDVPIVAHTSEPGHIAAVKARSAGMDAFVGKPSTQAQLIQALRNALDARVAARAAVEKRLSGRRFLVADDAEHNRKTVAAYLRHAGATVVQVSHGGAVLEQLNSQEHWDAVILDINMPGMDGLQTAEAIRRLDAEVRDVPLVALTAHSGERVLQAARAAGMNAFITKPVDTDVLYATLAGLVEGVQPGQPLLQPASDPDWTVGGETLLNPARLESYGRIGMLDELLADYVPEIGALAGKLQGHAKRQDLKGCVDVLHSLLGMSGEAGAHALYRAVRQVYVPMVETGQWPSRPDWEGQIAAVAARTEQALQAYRAAHASANES